MTVTFRRLGNDNLGQFYKTSTQNGKLVPWTALGLEPVVHVTGNHNDYGGRRRRLIDGTENVDGADVERKWRSTLVRSALGSAVLIAGVALVILASEYSKKALAFLLRIRPYLAQGYDDEVMRFVRLLGE